MIDTQNIIQAAAHDTGLADFGNSDVREALDVLVNACNTEARLSDAGEQRVAAAFSGYLANRIAVTSYLSRHPELLQRPIEKPTFVFGLPRTGTTLAINLLNADVSRRCLLRWESQTPVPPALSGQLNSDSRYEACKAQTEMALKYVPHIAAIHFEEADSPTECQFAMAPSFSAQIFDSQFHIPSYRKWLFNASYLPAMQFHKQLLQVLQENNSGQWTLKNPWHPLYLQDLITVYPDAQLIMTHRDPVEVVGSACSLVNAVRHMYSDDVRTDEIANSLLETFDLMIARQRAFRREHGSNAIYDVRYVDLVKDPIETMKKLYTHFEKPFTPTVQSAMAATLANNPKNKHGKHEYSLSHFGLSELQIRSRYSEYCAEFGL